MPDVPRLQDPTRLSQGNVPPADPEAEALVLGQLFFENADVDRAVASDLRPHHFGQLRHNQIYAAMLELHAASKEVHPVAVAQILRDQGKLDGAGGTPYLAQLVALPVVTAQIEQYCESIRDCWRARQLISVQQVSIASLYHPKGKPTQEHLEEQEAALWALTHDSRSQTYELAGAIAGRALREYAEHIRDGGGMTGHSTGFEVLDKVTTGYHAGEQWIVAARPGMGKTAWICESVLNVTKPPPESLEPAVPIVLPNAAYVHSLEMPKEQLALRMVCSLAGVPFTKIRAAEVNRDDWSKLTAAAAELARRPILIDDRPAVTMLEVRSNIRKIKREIQRGTIRAKKLVLVAIDYLQLMRGEQGQGREREISSLSQEGKNLSKTEDLCVVQLSQLNRAVEKKAGGEGKEKRPELQHLRESGSIEQDADTVVFIYREAYYTKDASPETELIIAKNRNGPTCTVRIGFDGPTMTFHNLARGNEEFLTYGDAPMPPSYGYEEEEERYP